MKLCIISTKKIELNIILVKNIFDQKKFQNKTKNVVLNIKCNNNKNIYETNTYISLKKKYKQKNYSKHKKCRKNIFDQ